MLKTKKLQHWQNLKAKTNQYPPIPDSKEKICYKTRLTVKGYFSTIQVTHVDFFALFSFIWFGFVRRVEQLPLAES